MSDFKDRLKEIVKKFGSVRALGEAAGISPRGIEQYFRGSQPTLEKLKAIANAGGVTVEWLATGIDRSKDQNMVPIEKVKDIISIVDDYLSSINRILPSDKKKELIVFLLEEYIEKQYDKETIHDHLKRILRMM